MSSCASSAAWNGGPSAAPQGDERSRGRRCGRPPRALEIVAVVFMFIYFWPVAVAYLVWKAMGYPMLDEARTFFRSKVREGFDSSFRSPFGAGSFGGAPFGGTGNAAFEDYRRRELERLEEERRRLDEEAHAFRDFVEELKRAKDREEFDAFMNRRRGAGGQPA
jgi:hypothetical protein